MIFNFFANKNDLCELFGWIANSGSFVFLETDSRPDQENRSYSGFPKDELIAEDRLDHVPIWIANAGSPPVAKQIRFNDDTQKRLKAMGRTSLRSPAIVVFHRFKTASDSLIGPIELQFETEKSVDKLKRYTPAQVLEMNWPEFRKSLDLIKRRVRATSAGKWKSMPVMPGTAEQLKQDDIKLWFWGAEGTI